MQNFWRRVAGCLLFCGAASHRSKLAKQLCAAKPSVMAVTVCPEGQIGPVVSTLSMEYQRSIPTLDNSGNGGCLEWSN